jgi:diguanylate cyclase (GGDEF)-like protein
MRDVTAQKQNEAQLKYMSTHDPLTGLYNRARFEKEINELQDNGASDFGIIVCDIDGLKLINDAMGHKQGDKYLIMASNIFKKSFRTKDTVARIGGDEFAVLLPHACEKSVIAVCARIKRSIEEYNEANPCLALNMSMGFALRNGTTKSPDMLFKEADNNMYKEKLHRRQSVRNDIVKTIMAMLEARDFYTEEHAGRLEKMTNSLSEALKLPPGKMADLRLLAQFHDIGKLGVPDRILFKPGSLDKDELLEMQKHCEIGHRIAMETPGLAPIADWILKHHEWWNGKGYPLGLKGEEIPLECRVLAIADTYDAMTNDRPYRRGMCHEKAIAEIERSSGIQFDPRLVKILLETFQSGRDSNEA